MYPDAGRMKMPSNFNTKMLNEYILAKCPIFNQSENWTGNMAVNETDFAHYAKKVGKARLLGACDDSISLIFDTGASLTCTPCKEDFISLPKLIIQGKSSMELPKDAKLKVKE